MLAGLLGGGGPGAPGGGALGSAATSSVLQRQALKRELHEQLRERYETLLARVAAASEAAAASAAAGAAAGAAAAGDGAGSAEAGEGAAAGAASAAAAAVPAVTPEDVTEELRRLVLMEGLPDDERVNTAPERSACSLRGRVWKVLIGVRDVDAEMYIDLVQQGESRLYQKIRNDTFRTFKNNQNFAQRVPEEQLIRILNAFLHYVDRAAPEGADSRPRDTKKKAPARAEEKEGDGSAAASAAGPVVGSGAGCVLGPVDPKLSYVQGMNVIAAPLLYTMPEVDAFFAFLRLVAFHTPRYYYSGIDGAFEGLKLVDQVLEVCDPELYGFLSRKNLSAAVYAMPPILSYSGSSPPLEQLLRLWDFMLAFGVHMNVVCTVARCMLMRDKLMKSPQPMLFLGAQFPPLEADAIVNLAVILVQQLPQSLYDRLKEHPYKAPPSPNAASAGSGSGSGGGGSRPRSEAGDLADGGSERGGSSGGNSGSGGGGSGGSALGEGSSGDHRGGTLGRRRGRRTDQYGTLPRNFRAPPDDKTAAASADGSGSSSGNQGKGNAAAPKGDKPNRPGPRRRGRKR